MIALLGCAAPPSCEANPERVATLLGILAGTEAAWVASDPPPVCFVNGVSGIRPDGTALLARTDADPDLAARYAHLAVHRRDWIPTVEPGPGCEASVDQALGAEGVAWAVEVGVRAELGLADALPFEAEVRGLAPDAQAERITAWLRANPHGGPGVDGVAAAYLARCR